MSSTIRVLPLRDEDKGILILTNIKNDCKTLTPSHVQDRKDQDNKQKHLLECPTLEDQQMSTKLFNYCHTVPTQKKKNQIETFQALELAEILLNSLSEKKSNFINLSYPLLKRTG